MLFVLNSGLTFGEVRYRGWRLVPAFVVYEVMSLVGTGVHVAVFTFLQETGFLLTYLGGAARLVHNLVGAIVALIINWYLNTTYLWRRRRD